MSEKQLQYRGFAQVYLQGPDALEPAADCGERQMSYFVGYPASAIQVLDYRQRPVEVAHRVLAGEEVSDFAGEFNRPAWVEIRATDKAVEIKLRDCRSEGELPTLWMGTTDSERLPDHPARWEVIKPLGRSRLAFAVLVP